VQSVPKSHCARKPYKAVSDPGPPSWHAVLLAFVQESSHKIGGEGGGGRKKRRPQSVQSVP